MPLTLGFTFGRRQLPAGCRKDVPMPASLSTNQSRQRRMAIPLLKSTLACLLTAQMALPAGLPAQSPAQSQTNPQMDRQMNSQSESQMDPHPHTALPAVPHSTQPLTHDEKILLILNRFTYGPRPGDLERVRAIGINAWFNQQIQPAQINDQTLEARLANYPAMQLSLQQLMEMYPTRGMIRANMRGNGIGVPGGEAEKAIYANEKAREEDKKKGKIDEAIDDTAPPPPDVAARILDLPPEKRFSALCKMQLPQLREFRRSLTPQQREHLTDGFTPQQLEALAAFNNPQAVVAAEDVQTKLLRDIYTERQLDEVMVDFWLNHFNVYMKKSQQAPYYIASYEREVIRPHALGRFEDLLVATATSPAMLNYLDNSSSIGPNSEFAHPPPRPYMQRFPQAPPQNNKKASGLNENYARELMELHTIGVNGGYTQHDVTEVAKVFTGWTVGPKQRFNRGEDIQPQFDPLKHEPGPKQVLGVTIKENGSKEGMQVLHLLATSPKTAQFISTKLAVRFVSDTPPQAMVDRMAKTFLSTSGDIRKVLATMINSPEFFTRDTYRAKVKTPQDFVVSAVRASGADVVSTGALVNVIAELGMPIYGMQTPNGYSMKADAWNNTAALIDRLNFALALSSNRVAGVTTDWPALLGNPSTPLTPEAKTAVLQDKLLHFTVSDRTQQTILTQISTDPEQQEASLRQVAAKDRKRDPLAVKGPAKRDTDMAKLDSESALAAGLLFGSPEFQRR
jgi:uncharacterized protein (DUF1800 family)